MARRKYTPLIDDDGEARTPTADEWAWSVRTEDFDGDTLKVVEFLKRRAEFLHNVEARGMDRAIFLPLSPGKPGFLERAAEMLEDLAKSARHAAE
jgi:hypothetical protein